MVNKVLCRRDLAAVADATFSVIALQMFPLIAGTGLEKPGIARIWLPRHG
jgi:hypothetical protein